MTEETKETFENLDAAFQGVKDDEQPEETKTPDEAAEAELEKTEKEQEIPVQKTEDEQPEQKEETGESWSTLGHPEFEGKSQKEIATILAQKKEETDYRNVLYGNQANEVGTLRKEIEELRGKLTDKPEKPKADEKLSGDELEAFHTLLETDPKAALEKFYGPQVESMVQKELEKALTSTGPVSQKLAEQMDAIQLQQLHATHTDAQEYVSEMTALDSPKSLGPQKRPHEEIYQLAKLWKANDVMWEPTYQLMGKYPQMPFTEAHAIASAQQVSTADTDTQKDKLKKQVDGLQKANPKTTTKTQAGKAEVYSSVDDAFDSIED